MIRLNNKRAEMDEMIKIVLWIIFFLVIGGLVVYKIISSAGN